MKGPLALLTGLSTILAWSTPAAAETAASCVATFDQGQELQAALKLQEARELFLSCARESCHAMVRKDCAAHLEEVARDMPSVSLGARDRSGADLTNVHITVDGAAVTLPKAGAALPLNPGEHSIRFESAGYEPRSERVVLRVGEKNRAVVITLDREGGERPISTPGREPHEKSSGRQPFVIALAGVSVLSLGGFAAFGLTGLSERNHLVETCAPGCSERATAVVRERYLAADVLLGVGVIAGVAAAILHFTAPATTSATRAARR